MIHNHAMPVWDDTYQAQRSLHRHFDFHATDFLPSWLAKILYPFEFENEFDGRAGIELTNDYWWLPIVTVVLYVVFVFVAPVVMKDREALNLQFTMKYWNLFLAVFSLIGFVRLLAQLALGAGLFGLDYTVCRPGLPWWGSGSGGVWGMLFVYSKYAELFDTVILVLRKRPVIFLHWYHHSTVMLVSLAGYAAAQPSAIYFCGINYGVHSVMYYYYYLMACGKKPGWAQAITAGQIFQMVIGFAVNVYQAYKMSTDSTCKGSWSVLAVMAFVYATYFVLFVNFAIARYFKKPGEVTADKKRAKRSPKIDTKSKPSVSVEFTPCGGTTSEPTSPCRGHLHLDEDTVDCALKDAGDITNIKVELKKHK